MSKKTIGIISVCIFSLYFGAIAFFISGTLLQIKSGSNNALHQFEILKKSAEKSVEQFSFMSQEYVDSLKIAIGTDKRLITATIDSINGVQFAYPLLKPFITVNDKSEPLIQVSSPLVKIFSSNFPVSDTGFAIITAAVYTILPETVIFYGKIAFLIVLAGTLTALFTGILSQTTAFTNSQIVTSAPQPKPIKQEAQAIEINPAPLSVVPETINEKITASYDSKTNDELYKQEMDSLLYDEEPISVVKEKIISQEPINNVTEIIEIHESGVKKAAIDPMGLFSPTTGLGWESYLETRLDAELIRSASSEQNLALLLISVPKISHDNPVAKEIADALINHFNFRDLLFEFTKDGYAIIIQDASIDQAIQYAESIYSDIIKIITPLPAVNAGIGISTRAQRLITGERLVNEAALALKKSFEEQELPIVAFKVNTEKYRTYLNEELRGSLTVK